MRVASLTKTVWLVPRILITLAPSYVPPFTVTVLFEPPVRFTAYAQSQALASVKSTVQLLSVNLTLSRMSMLIPRMSFVPTRTAVETMLTSFKVTSVLDVVTRNTRLALDVTLWPLPLIVSDLSIRITSLDVMSARSSITSPA